MYLFRFNVPFWIVDVNDVANMGANAPTHYTTLYGTVGNGMNSYVIPSPKQIVF